MTVETIEKDGVTVKILYGFGRLQKAHHIIYSFMPDRLKRIQASGGEIEDSDLKQVSPEEVLEYNAKANPALVKLVLQSASDWDPSKMGVDEYVDTVLPEEVGLEIVKRVKAATTKQSLSPDEKKT